MRSRLLLTRRQRGGGCHGRRNLFWKSHGGGLEVLCCAVCGRAHGERRWCLRCERLKAAEECRVCRAGREVAAPLVAAVAGQAAAEVQARDPESLACEDNDGLCCRHGRMRPSNIDEEVLG